MLRSNREQQQLGLVGNGPEEGETGKLAIAIAGKDKLHPRHGQDPRALRTSPRLAKAIVEGRIHDASQGIEIGRAAFREVKLFCGRSGAGAHAAFRARASGARA